MYCWYLRSGCLAYCGKRRDIWSSNWLNVLIFTHANLTSWQTKQNSAVSRCNLSCQSDLECLRRASRWDARGDHRKNRGCHENEQFQSPISIAWDFNLTDFSRWIKYWAIFWETTWCNAWTSEEWRCFDKKSLNRCDLCSYCYY